MDDHDISDHKNMDDEIYSNGVVEEGLSEAVEAGVAVTLAISNTTPDTETERLAYVKVDVAAPKDVSDKNSETACLAYVNVDVVASKDISDKKVSEESHDSPRVSEVNRVEVDEPTPKRRRQLSLLASKTDQVAVKIEDIVEEEGNLEKPAAEGMTVVDASATKSVKKPKKRNNNIWTKSTSRKGKKKAKNNNAQAVDDPVYITPMPRLDRNDDNADMEICLSKVYKAEKVELSDDRLSAGSTKGYRTARATRGVVEGAWYFEIKVVSLGETGHTRLGWITDNGDLQAPVGYDANSYGYRDIDGCKIYKASKEKYGDEGYTEGDIIGFYINLPEGSIYAPKQHNLVLYKGQRYASIPAKEEVPKVVPGSEISFFKNGICQGTAFLELFGGCYYPAASMYTLPNQPNCVVKFNFGPDFDFFPDDFGNRPSPKPMNEVPYHGYESKLENGDAWSYGRMCTMLNMVKGADVEIAKAAEAIC